MSKRLRITIGIVSSILVGGALWQLLRLSLPPDPIYKGQPLSFWVRGYHSATSGILGRPEAEEAVRHAGTNAIPCLLRMVRANDSRFELMLTGLMQKQHLIKVNHVSAWERNWGGAFGFETVGADAKDAVPALIAIYNQNVSDSSQGAAAYALASTGPAAKQAVPSLLKGLPKATGSARGNTLLALARIGSDSDIIVPTLMKYLRDPDPRVRWSSVCALDTLGARASNAGPAVLELLHDPDKRVRDIVESTLQKIDPKLAPSAGAL